MDRVGIIGGGQLAWMMCPPAQKLGIDAIVQTPSPKDPAAATAVEIVLAPVADATATAQLAQRCDVITFENEFVDLEALSKLARQGVCFRPSLESLAPLLDKYHQRSFLQDLGVPVPKFFTLTPNKPLPELQFPVVLKARRHGYDGRGTAILKDWDSLKATWQDWLKVNWDKSKQPSLLLEEFIPFDRELAVIAARNASGEIAIYPIVETQQEDQVCRRVLVPTDVPPAAIERIEAISRTILEKLQVVGLFAIELFLTRDGKVLVNEIAPRTHNSGHFSIDASETSQFEQHLRAVSDRPLGSTAMTCAGAVMVNLLGYETSNSDYLEKRQQLMQIPNTRVYWYGKTESRPGRKLGHVTVLLDGTHADLRKSGIEVARKIESIWYPN
ncbi:5-(carboxyamino)imidazole ribonucleotide synthase [Oscillatoriales cyanobacterium LEGE 11467]|uniref:N5-carboxyaminoimidazole ribonucleotide synthase n=1 Tax=Zarconia navalis LEGE 11467 TaxID=1828826 RepID=A0A928Z965_9CYAN|nr:5-(carboxyamino)imidazole ribonucleotide synthase [Zarconia navalis LEGE 11467]